MNGKSLDLALGATVVHALRVFFVAPVTPELSPASRLKRAGSGVQGIAVTNREDLDPDVNSESCKRTDPRAATALPIGLGSYRWRVSIEVAGDDPLADGMRVAVRLRRDFIVTDGERLLAAGRRVYMRRNPTAAEDEVAEAVTCAADLIYVLLENAGLIGDAADAALAAYESDGLAPGGWRGQLTIDDPWPLEAGPDCVERDVFKLPSAGHAESEQEELPVTPASHLASRTPLPSPHPQRTRHPTGLLTCAATPPAGSNGAPRSAPRSPRGERG